MMTRGTGIVDDNVQMPDDILQQSIVTRDVTDVSSDHQLGSVAKQTRDEMGSEKCRS
jgi:hypothetical protein